MPQLFFFRLRAGLEASASDEDASATSGADEALADRAQALPDSSAGLSRLSVL